MAGFLTSNSYGIGMLYLIMSGFAFMFINLSDTRTGASAYSIFNKNAARIAGTFDAEQIVNRRTRIEHEEPDDYVPIPTEVPADRRIRNKPCPCGSGYKHKDCCFLKKFRKDSDDY